MPASVCNDAVRFPLLIVVSVIMKQIPLDCRFKLLLISDAMIYLVDDQATFDRVEVIHKMASSTHREVESRLLLQAQWPKLKSLG